MTSDTSRAPHTPFRLLVTGGGTGGHTYPALTAIRALRDRLAGEGRGLDVLWIGTAEGLEARVAPAEGIPFTTVATGKIRRSSNPPDPHPSPPGHSQSVAPGNTYCPPDATRYEPGAITTEGDLAMVHGRHSCRFDTHLLG